MWVRALDRVVRIERGRVLAHLIRLCGGRFQLAEDALQDALQAAVETWPVSGVPEEPVGWLVTTARRKVIDRLRHEHTKSSKAEALRLETLLTREGEGRPDRADRFELYDDRLRLIFTCCHPALAPEAQVALTLRTLGGMTTLEIARAFLVREATMAQRLVRAKKKIVAAGIPFEVPGPRQWLQRLEGVLRTVYLIFNEGFFASSGPSLTRDELAREATRLARLLHQLLPEEAEVEGLVALFLLHLSRSTARIDDDGELVLLEEQDRALWDRALADEGIALVSAALAKGPVGPYQIEAAIAAVHAEAESFSQTDWSQVALLYDELFARLPTPVVELNRAVAYGMVDGPKEGLRRLDALVAQGGQRALESYPALPLARADMLFRLGRSDDGHRALDCAETLATNEVARRFVQRRRSRHGGSRPSEAHRLD